MKKLLSICFLSILLGLLSFSTWAQSSSGSSNCASGFWIQNLQPDTITGIVNLPSDMPNTGKLPLSHTLGNAFYNPLTGNYAGNAHPQVTELYELHFCNTCGLDPKTKVSVDWLLYRDGQLVNDNLSDYVEFGLYTLYSKLNQYGECQSISWLGGIVPNEFGYCDQVSGNYTLYDSIHGLNGPCNDPTNYPGAMQVEQGTPMAVLTQLGQIVPAGGQVSLYSQHLDYFYLDFFQQTRTIVQIKWKQVGNYKLVMRIRERLGGTPWNNMSWNENETEDFVGGHQSCCGRILAEDSIDYPYLGEFSKEVCEEEHYIFGRPEYDFHVTMPDTNVVFGQYVFEETDCKYFQTDSIYRFHFFVRNTPEVVVLKEKDTLCKCSSFGPEQLLSMITYDTVDLQYASDHKFMWYYWGANGYGWYDQMPKIDTVVGTYQFIVRQVNTYTNFNQFYSDELDTVVCSGDPDTIYVTFLEMDPPVVPDPADICLEVIDSTFIHTVVAEHDQRCATTTRWYKTVSTSYSSLTEYLSDLVYTGDEFPIHLIDYAPATNVDKTVKFYAVSYDTTRNCESKYFTTYTIYIHQTPELVQVAPVPTEICPGSEATLKVKINNNPNQTDPAYTYYWNGDVTEVLVDGTREAFVADQDNQVGTGNSNNAYFPFYTNAKYAFTQQIFTPAEVGSGEITKLTFEYAGTAPLTKDVVISFTTTPNAAFNTSTRAWYLDNLQTVYEGTLTVNGAGMAEIELQTPYVYTSTTENLVLTVAAASNGTIAYGNNFKTSTCQGNKGMAYYGSTKYNDPNNIPANSANRKYVAHRNNVKFHVQAPGFTTNAANQTAYNMTDPKDSCHTAYETTVYVVDANGCKSEPVVFNYISNDTINPTVSKSTVTTDIYACHLDTVNAPIYKTVDELEAGAGVLFEDNCRHDLLVIAEVSSVVNSISDTTCHEVLTRTYTVKDHCGNAVVFTHIFVSQDTTKPTFVFEPGVFPYVRLYPVEGGNCTFNSPDSMEFVNAVASHVFDNCTDSAYLMSTVKFFWENTTESPINGVDIFRVDNHLSVVAQITDRCGNVFESMIIYIDRPEKISIKPNAVTSTGDQCFGDTATLHFDISYIVDDTVMGPFVPYTYEWREVNGRPVTFITPNDTTTQVVFPGTGDYSFEMVVTDRNGCVAVSEPPVVINVRPLPNVVINHIVINGQVEPYCPTYGNLTIEAVIVDPVEGQTVARNAYEWTGESVNIHSDSARTWVTIVPEWCDTMYYPTVTVTDDRGCKNTVTDTIDVFAEGPQFFGSIADTTVEKQMGCKYYIPDFKSFITADLVKDDCYTFSQLKYSDAYGTVERTDWYSQSPAAGSELTETTKVVTITITNPCGKANTITVNVHQPDDALAVTIDPVSAAECQEYVEENGVEFTTTVVNAMGQVTYEWTVDDEVAVLGHNATFTAQGAMEPGTYTYTVTIEDEYGCVATDDVDLTVYFQGADPVLRKWPNILCQRFNGALVVDVAPTGYAYNLQHNDFDFFHFFKISENPHHQPTEWNTITFDSLRPGWYTLTVYTNEGCERDYQVFISDSSSAPFAPEFTTVDVTLCSNDNGVLNISALPGFTYQLYHMDGNEVGELVGNATSYTNLPVGKYMIHTTQLSTHCVKDTTFMINDSAPRPIPTYDPTPNNNCENIAGIYNGKINITSNPAWYYTVYTIDGEDTTYVINNATLNNTNNPITGVQNDVVYYIAAYNPENGCSTINPVQAMVGFKEVTVALNVSTTPNFFCLTDTANGIVKITSTLSNFLDYNILLGTDTIGKKADYIAGTGWGGLYEGTYNIQATDKYYCHATKADIVVDHVTIDPQITATSTMNPSCVKDLGTITLTNTNASAMNVLGKGYAHMANYKIETEGFVKDTATTATTFTFTGVPSGLFVYTATTNYGCFTTDTISVAQYELPSMILDSTPNHMCAPTFEKPGDGTVIIKRPTAENVPGHFFEYKFYDAAGNEMTVPYDLPLTHTKYWLSAQRYRVVAYDTVSGCTVEGYITVEDSLYEVDFDYASTPNYACNTVDGTGTITVVNATSTNPDAVLAYSIDSVNYQLDPVFTGLKDSVYTVYVMDTVMKCYAVKNVVVNPTDSCAPVITICDNLGNCGTQFDYCFGAEGIQLCATAEDTCDNATFTYSWYAPCADPNTSNTSCIDVQTDHYMVNSCEYILTAKNDLTGCEYNVVVYVAIHPIPELTFTINGEPADLEHTNTFCETDTLHIAIVSTQELDTTTIEWTLGYIGTGVAEIDVVGLDYELDNVTFCARGASKFGCVSPFASLPVTFIRTVYDTLDVVSCDSVIIPGSTKNTLDGVVNDIVVKATSFPYYDTLSVAYISELTGCDSLVTYNVKLISAPEITPDNELVVDAFCETENYTLADFVDSLKVNWNGDEGTTKWIAAEMVVGDETFTRVTNFSDFTDGRYVITDQFGTVAMINEPLPNQASDASYALVSAPIVTTNPDDNMVWIITKNNSDGTYTIKGNDGRYLAGNTNNKISFNTTSTAIAARWWISGAQTSGNPLYFAISNADPSMLNRYIKYNTQAPRFACYLYNTGNTNLLALWKSNTTTATAPAGELDYVEVPASTVVDYEFATTHDVKYVATNDCGADTTTVTFDVSKSPAIDSFQLQTSYCNNVEATVDFVVSSFGHMATATLTLDGEEVASYDVDGEEVALTYTFTPRYYLHHNKVLTLTVSNDNGLCLDTVANKTIIVDTTIYKIMLDTTYCEDDIFNVSDYVQGDFTGIEVNAYKEGPGYFYGLDDGEPLTPDHNGVKVYFTMLDHCGNNVVSDTVELTVNPKAKLTVKTTYSDLCLADAFDAFDTVIVSTDAENEGWLYQTTEDGAYIEVPSINALIDAIKVLPQAWVSYHVENECATDTQSVGRIRILGQIELVTEDVTVCPGLNFMELVDSVMKVTAITDSANYKEGEISFSYALIRDGEKLSLTVDGLVFQTNDSLMIIATPSPNCGPDTAYSKLTVLSNTFEEPVFQPGCEGDPLSAFIQTPPVWTGTANVVDSFWLADQLYYDINDYSVRKITVDSIMSYDRDPYLQYVWVTECGDMVYTEWFTTIQINNVPVLKLKDIAGVCDGTPIDPANAINTITYRGNEDKYDTIYTVDGVVVDENTVYTTDYDGKFLVVTLTDNGEACGSVVDSVEITVFPLPEPTITGPARACADQMVMFTATPDNMVDYTYYVDDPENTYEGEGNHFAISFGMNEEGVRMVNVYVTVTDENGCSATSETPATVKVTNMQQFIFFNEDGSENVEHAYIDSTGYGLNYGWMISTECNNVDTLVYVEYDIYFNDQIISNDSIGEFFATSHVTDQYGNTYPYISTNTFHWLSGDGTNRSNTSLYNYAVANPTTATAGNHFPNTNLGLSNANVYDDLWLHFIGDRKVDVTFVPFRLNGTYKVVYRLYSTSHEDHFMHYYTEDNPDHENYGSNDQFLGGQNALVEGAIRKLLAIDSITITVTGENILNSTTPEEQPVVVTPEIAPVLTVDETQVAPDMEVWPNPAPAVTTTLKARVHNMNGEATVTLTSLSGKQVYTGTTYIDNDNYYFEFDVNSLSVGSYIMTVRTNDAIVTKKVIVTILAR